MPQHAILSASAASRWLVCTPSARLEQRLPDTAGTAAAEGTLAHSFLEAKVSHRAGLTSRQKYNQTMFTLKKDKLFQKEMNYFMDELSAYFIERLANARAKDQRAGIELEKKVDYSEWVPEGFGTRDIGLWYLDVLEVHDMKYGKGVPVSAEENKQMMLYALGSLKELSGKRKITKVILFIHQPRLDSRTSWEISVEDLLLWAEKTLKPIAKKAFKGEGSYKPGKHCMFCRAKAKCKANATYQLEIAKYDFQKVDLLTDVETVDILNRAKDFKSWIKSVEDNALHEAVANKKEWPEMKLVEGTSKRIYKDLEKIQSRLSLFGFSEDEYIKKQMQGISILEKLMSRKMFNVLMAGLIIKPQGKPTLVPVIDPRPVYIRNTALQDFADIEVPEDEDED